MVKSHVTLAKSHNNIPLWLSHIITLAKSHNNIPLVVDDGGVLQSNYVTYLLQLPFLLPISDDRPAVDLISL